MLTVFVFCFAITSCKDFQSNDLLFDQNEWKKSGARVRGRMYSNLLSQKILLGKTRHEVIEMLGEPDETYPDIIKYAIDLGGIDERWLQRYFLFISFDERTNEAIKAVPGDS